ncbi:MAG: 2-C-methyl-D-erythritol 2,4-cyclodiphosphate synthase [Treponema sp.]|jgi:2-C-methyl-D-erythritol 2,4-cyclodiphosphate synthase/2-C-methyl-D-erythritol 4-phosphate cytidylyltransferase/2-C-methyl-D-erythritol 2,4-cyclodiphosphate synthase|nr:2-C-methyl-D-erythritol 2,4-cyclodiphosphate synthase [Treponema sp.]
MKTRIGLGHDLHRLVEGRPFLLAGVHIPFPKGEEGHSDSDVLAHAVIDAVLGAACLGDIGEFFPPEDPRYKDADSMELLRISWAKVKSMGWRLSNLDCCVLCEAPKILPFREQIRSSLAQSLGVDIETIFVKAKTGEGLGPIGEGLAVEAEAVCLLTNAEP